VPHERYHAGRVQNAARKDGRVRPAGADGGGVYRWYSQLPHRSVRRPDQQDVLYWIRADAAFGRRAVYLDDANTSADLPDFTELLRYKAMGINIVAPPTFALLDLDGANNIVPSRYARDAKAAGLDIITWTLERSGILADGNNGFYFQTIDAAIRREGGLMKVLDVLAKDVGILGVFSDWAAPVTYYANCMGLR
jgi:glycerophosphoryl diester phosphodiesterase